jgi:hypothetical protein
VKKCQISPMKNAHPCQKAGWTLACSASGYGTSGVPAG